MKTRKTTKSKIPACFKLIKSLEKAEKIYFKRYLSAQNFKGEPTIYLKLFNELDKMKKYDIAILNKKFKDEIFLDHLAVSLNYLYNILLNSLLSFNDEKDDVLKAAKMLGQIRVLFKKRLFKQCDHQIKRARKFLEERQLNVHLYLLAAYEFNLIVFTLMKNELSKYRTVQNARAESLKQINNEFEVIDLNNQLLKFMRIKEANSESTFKAELKPIEKKLKLLEPNLLDGSAVLNLFYQSTSERIYYLKNEPLKSYNALKNYVEIWKTIPPKLKYNLSAYMNVLKNFLGRSAEMWNANEIEFYLPELEMIKSKRKDLKDQCNMLYARFSFWMNLIRGDFEQLQIIVQENLLKMETIEKKFADYYKYFIYTSFATYYFLIENHQQVLEFSSKLWNTKNVDTSIIKYNYACKFLTILSHFNLGNFSLVKSLSLSLERKLKNIQTADNEYVMECKWLKKLQKVESIYLTKKSKIDFIESLVKFKNNKTKINVTYLLIETWCIANRKNISLKIAWRQVAKF